MHLEKSLSGFRFKAGCHLIHAKFCFESESDHIIVMILFFVNNDKATGVTADG